MDNNSPTPQNTQPAAEVLDKAKAFLGSTSISAQVAAAGAAPTYTPQTQAMTSVRGMTNLIDALSTKGMIPIEEVKNLKFEVVTKNQSAEDVIKSHNLVSIVDIQKTKAEMYGIGFIDLQTVPIDFQMLNRIPKETALRNMAILFEESASRVKLAMSDPLDLQKVKFFESLLLKKVDTYFADPQTIQSIIDTKYGAQLDKEVDQALESVGVLDLGSATGRVADLTTGTLDNAPVTKIVNMILDFAIKHHASDIHIEPREGKVSVRYRLQGVLSEKLTIPAKLGPTVVSRIKILANMKIDEHRIPQDNRFQVKTDNQVVDMRVSIMPTIYGEKVVMRLLEKGGGLLSLEQTGMRGSALKIYRESLAKTQGIILITGPTGSGKTVTLASSLGILNKPEVNIVTIEDPVEIRVDGINQVQVQPEVGLTFASGLRSFLRQNPDVIMVGEIRDKETAALAVQAALTGQLVLATLHTNSAAGALPRLLDMGIEPFLLASTINVIVGQRLIRKLCDDSKQPYAPTEEVTDMFHHVLDGLNGFDTYSFPKSDKIHFDSQSKDIKLYKAVPSTQCGDSGYTGRIGIFEVMRVTEKIGQMIMSNISANEIQKQAVLDGMITMEQDGFIKALEGITTVEEVLRVRNT